MPSFHYTAKQGPHKITEGVIDAENSDAAIKKLVQMGLAPIDVQSRGDRQTPPTPKFTKPLFLFRKGVSALELTLFTRQASDLVDAGVPILQILRIMAHQTTQPYFRGILEKIFDAVKDGEAFSDALARHPQIFSKIYVNMVHSGELSGNLDVVLARLADFMERDQETRAQVKTSMIYPAVVLVVAGLTIFGLFTFVIPRIMGMFEDMGQDFPWPTVVIMGISYFFQRFWWAIVGAVALAVFYFQKVRRTSRGKLWMDRMQLKIPVLGNFIRAAEIGRFSRCLGTLIESGVVIVTALDGAWGLVENEVLKEGVKNVAQDVANGAGLTASLRAHAVFPEEAISMVAVGEESGQLARGLNKLAEYYERQAQRFVRRMTSLIEPMMILFLGLIVGFIFIGMLLPILRMNLMIK